MDGVVLANDTVADGFVRAVCRGTPTVLLARNPVLGCDAVLVENERAAEELTDHLVAHGRRRLVFADGSGRHLPGRHGGRLRRVRRRWFCWRRTGADMPWNCPSRWLGSPT
ncbi:MAG: hypothetical protein ACR2JD_01910 [Nocardioides sp.]